MSFSSDDSYSTPSPIPSPQEFSHLITDPDTLHSIARRFASRKSSSTILRYYKFLSQSVAQLEEELERHQREREIIYDHLFDNRSFRMMIRPIVNEYRHKRTLIRQGFHPYSRTLGSPNISSTNNTPSIDEFPSQPAPIPTSIPSPIDPLSPEGIQGRASVEIHDQPDNDLLSSYYTAIDDTLGSKKNPIVISDDEEVHQRRRSFNEIRCGVCNKEGHFILDCTKEYRIDGGNEGTQGHFSQ
jgi:hypothetical protein